MLTRILLHFLRVGLTLLAFLLLPAVPAQAASDESVALPKPDTSGGASIMRAFANRRSTKSGYTGAPLPAQELSNLLWATWGVNRTDGRRTAPSGMNRQDVAVFAVKEDGVWRYEAGRHELVKVLDGDRRAATGGGSLVLLYAAPESQWSGMHVGSLYQNAGLYCAAAGIGNYVHASGVSALKDELPLPDGYRVLIAQTVGQIK